jgi:hypothetical protein
MPFDDSDDEELRRKVTRVGCWFYGAAVCRSAYRDWDDPSRRRMPATGDAADHRRSAEITVIDPVSQPSSQRTSSFKPLYPDMMTRISQGLSASDGP